MIKFEKEFFEEEFKTRFADIRYVPLQGEYALVSKDDVLDFLFGFIPATHQAGKRLSKEEFTLFLIETEESCGLIENNEINAIQHGAIEMYKKIFGYDPLIQE
jgi:hypothetical protein